MSDSVPADQHANRSMFEEVARVNIAQLNPNAHHIENHHIQATVALIWPYSSSTQRLSLLLAEKDIRLRKSKGQVKVTFHGGCAREVAQTQVGIGDLVRLGLRDVAWTRTGEEVSTPGKKVDWDIDIRKRVVLECKKPNHAIVAIDHTAKSPSPEQIKNSAVQLDGPTLNGFIKIQQTHVLGPYFSPAGQHSRRATSGSFVDASLDPFADDDGYIVGKGRKRTKFTRHSGSWHLLNDDDDENGPTLTSGTQNTLPSPSQTPSRIQSPSLGGVAPESQAREVQEVVDRVRGGDDGSDESSLSPVVRETAGIAEQHQAVEHSHLQIDTETEPATEQQSAEISPMLMGPPRTPSPTLRRHILQTKPPNSAVPVMTPTPILRPLPSPGLALVSPLVERPGLSTGYFPMVANVESELDATGSYSRIPEPPILAPGFVSGDTKDVHDRELEDRDNTEIASAKNLDHTDIANSDGRLFILTDHGDAGVSRTPQSLSFTNRAIASTSEDMIMTPTMSDFVDLDALQQHVEESALELHNAEQDDQPEDEDMYGPPVDHRPDPTPATGPTDEVILVPGQSSTRFVHETPLPLTHGYDSGNTLFEEIHATNDQRAQQLPFTLEGPSVSRQSEFEDVPHTNDEAEERLAEMRVPQGRAFISDAISHPSVVQSYDMPQRSISSNGSDGTADLVENEAERIRQRASLTGSTASQPEVVDLLSSSSESASPASQVSDAPISQTEAGQEALEPGKESASMESSVYNHEDKGESDDANIQREIVDADSQDQLPSVLDQLPHLITPDATQKEVLPAETKTPTRTTVPVILPPTPILTQDTTDAVLLSSPTAPQTNLVPLETTETPASILPVEENRSIRRATQRLSRKVLTSQIVTNEYFTPRRSARISQPSPSPTLSTSPTKQYPSSPIRPRTRSTRSVSISLSEQEGIAADRAVDKGDLQPSMPARGITTQLSYFPHLSTLSEYFNLEVDVIAVCLADSVQPQRAKSGPKDFYTTLLLTDESLDKDSTAVSVQIFRPRKNALPVARRGDAVLLRNMKVQTLDRNTMLLSTDTSAWAVVKRTSDSDLDVIIEGPPMEYDQGEKDAADRLLDWWHSHGEKLHHEVLEASHNQEVQETTSTPQIMTRSQRRKANATDHTDSTHDSQTQETRVSPIQSTEHVEHPSLELASPTQSSAERMSPTTPVKRSSHRQRNSRRSESVVHELRDGTRYVTEEDGRGTSVLHELRDGTAYVDE